jgi:hypothetical protein
VTRTILLDATLERIFSFFPLLAPIPRELIQHSDFLTLVHSLVDNGADVEIKVSTWDANGVAAPNVSFDWRCRVPLLDLIFVVRSSHAAV